MKKVLFLMAVIFMAFTVKAADVDAHVAKVNELVEKLNQQLDKAPKDTGVADIDNFIKENKECAEAAVASASVMTDLLANNANIPAWIELGLKLKEQGEQATKIGQDVDKATKALKAMPKMKAVGAAMSLKWATDLLPITIEAITEEGLVVSEMTK